MSAIDLFARNAAIASDVLIKHMDLQSAVRKYRLTMGSLRAVLLFQAHSTLGFFGDESLAQIREAVSERLKLECIDNIAAPAARRARRSGTG